MIYNHQRTKIGGNRVESAAVDDLDTSPLCLRVVLGDGSSNPRDLPSDINITCPLVDCLLD